MKVICENQPELYKKAALFLQENEFDLAYREYGKILDNDSGDAAAHWGQFLCRYGIEYVTDPATGTRKPTLHRNMPQSVLECPAYLLAVELAEETQADEYRKQAEEIRRIQMNIEAAARKMDPFDIFISYKEEAEEEKDGKTGKVRTLDSYRAQDIYRSLTDLGYHVFYARETLAKRAGEEYEPIIYSALSSAKMMLVLGTKKEYFTATWVRNEWSRFLEFREKDRTKILVPIYYEDFEILPDELAVILEVQNMQEPDFQSELLKYVKATVKPNLGRKLAAKRETVQSKEELRRKTLLNEAMYALENSKFEEANRLYDELIQENELNYQICIGKLLAQNRACNLVDLVQTCSQKKQDISGQKWYQEAEKTAGDNEREELHQMVADIQEQIVRDEKREKAGKKYQSEYRKLDAELAYIAEQGGKEVALVGAAAEYIKRRNTFLERREQLRAKENMEQPSFGTLLINLIIMLLPATVTGAYFFRIPGIDVEIPESILLVAVILIIGHSVLMLWKKCLLPIAATLVWTVLLTVFMKSNSSMYFLLMEGAALLVPLATIANNMKLSSRIKAYKKECQQYTAEVETLQNYVQESVIPVYKEQIKQLSKLAAESGIKTEERLAKEVEMLGRLEPLKQRITLELSLDR